MSDFPSENFGTSPNVSEEFGSIPKDAESFRIVQNSSERKSDHTLIVREVARMFEEAGVARTERSITNWCQPNKTGIARLDAFFDSNERRYFITPQSVEIAIQEELSKERVREQIVPHPPKDLNSPGVRNSSEAITNEDVDEIERLRQEIIDLKILNQGKDQFVNLLKQEREQFAEERRDYTEKLMTFNRLIGQLETRLGIEAPTRRFDILQNEGELQNGAEATDLGSAFSES